MDHLLTFITSHPVLVGGIVVVTMMLINSLFAEKLRGYTSVTPTQTTQMMNHENAIILDVREMKEYSSGHIVNSVHIPLSNLKTRISELDKYKNQKIIVSCRSGNRSSQACASLKKEGFEEVFNLSGGIMAWENASLPLVK